MKTSFHGRAFISAHEGNPTTAYLDPVGVPTIGHGFTMRSAAVKAELAKLGITKLIPGKTKITKEQSDKIFMAVLASKEFEGTVNSKMPSNRNVKQHMFDAMVSATWNLGPAFMGWRWIAPWRDRGDVSASADIWAVNYNKAGGKKLPGLVRRRKEEALLFEKGIYTGIKNTAAPEGVERDELPVEPKQPDPVTKEAQEILAKLGIDPGKADGWYGPKTKAAIETYQKLHPHLKVDGKLGIATLTQLRKDVESLSSIVKDTATKGGGGAVVTGAGAFFAGFPWYWIAGGVIVIAGAYFAWRYRDVLKRKFNSLFNREENVQ